MNDSEIIDFLIKNLEGNNAANFSRKTGISTSIVSRIRSGELRLKMKINQILEAYPNVSRNFLETGMGYPGDISVEIVINKYKDLLAEKDEQIATLYREMALQQRVIEKLTK